jgi:hypothetical protein
MDKKGGYASLLDLFTDSTSYYYLPDLLLTTRLILVDFVFHWG